MRRGVVRFFSLAVLLAAVSGCASIRYGHTIQGPCPKLLAALPQCVTTPDGMAVDSKGRLVIACPNFTEPRPPACLMRIDRPGGVPYKWIEVPVLAETGIACPMGIAFGPDGDLYVCDNQAWLGTPQGQFKGRLLRLKIDGDRVVKTTVVAEGLEHPNGVRIHDGHIYITQSSLSRIHSESDKLTSGIYRFRLDDENLKMTNTTSDRPWLIAMFTTRNPYCQYGLDGIVFDSKGNLFVGNFGDGEITKLTFNDQGQVATSNVFAKTDFGCDLDPNQPGFIDTAKRTMMRTTDGMCIDKNDTIYIADFSNNAIARVTKDGQVSVLWQNDDTDGQSGLLNEPGEPIIWNGSLVVSNFDAVYGPKNRDKVNTKNDQPSTLSIITLNK